MLQPRKPLLTRFIEAPWPFLVKALFYGTFYGACLIRRATGRATRPLEFGPQIPGRPYLQWKVAKLLGRTPAPVSGDARAIRFYFLDSTGPRDGGPAPEGALNAGATDISKSRVQRVFHEVFGYSLEVDPTTHRGPMVCKAETNAVHDGRIVEGPIDRPEAGAVYQVVVDNTVGGGGLSRTCARLSLATPCRWSTGSAARLRIASPTTTRPSRSRTRAICTRRTRSD